MLESSPLVNMHRPPTDLERKLTCGPPMANYIHDGATVLLSCLTFRLDFVRNFKELNQIQHKRFKCKTKFAARVSLVKIWAKCYDMTKMLMIWYACRIVFFVKPWDSSELRSSALSWCQSTGSKQETVKNKEIARNKKITFCFCLSSLLTESLFLFHFFFCFGPPRAIYYLLLSRV